MNAPGRTAVVTMTRARTAAESSLLLDALQALDRFDLPVFVADGGSTVDFTAGLSRLRSAQVSQEGSTLAGQIKGALRRAIDAGFDTLIYTEPDKKLFFETGFGEFLHAAEAAAATLVIPQRSEAGLHTFPPGQRSAELAFNRLASDLLSHDPMDWLYGPLSLPAAAIVPCLDRIPEHIGWGWRPFVIASWMIAGGPVQRHPGDFHCPEDQRGEDDLNTRIYRLEQLRQNIEGLQLGLRTSVTGAQG